MHVVLSRNLDLLFQIVQHSLFIWRDSHDETSACIVQILKEIPENTLFTLILKNVQYPFLGGRRSATNDVIPNS